MQAGLRSGFTRPSMQWHGICLGGTALQLCLQGLRTVMRLGAAVCRCKTALSRSPGGSVGRHTPVTALAAAWERLPHEGLLSGFQQGVKKP